MTVLAHKKRLVFFIISLLIIVLTGFLLKNQYAEDRVVMSGYSFVANIMDNDALRQKGLSGRTNMQSNEAMLFKFEEVSERCFWMKEMNFDIDIIWLDGGYKVTAIEQNISPDTYPKEYCHNGQYVVEIKAGLANELDLKNGDKIKY